MKRPSVLVGQRDGQTAKEYVKSLREVKTVVNSSIVVSAADGIVKSHDSGLLESNGGHIKCTKHWAKHFLSGMGYVNRKANTKASISDVSFEADKEEYPFDIGIIVDVEEIPKELVISWDHIHVLMSILF